MRYGHIKSPSSGEIVDEVLLTVLRAPRTYTAEDVIEISCHGGTMSLKKVLELCLTEGARLAEPGEFTKRAFLSGRIDLSQAEAVLDIIKSETDTSRKVSVDQLRGVFSEEIRALRAAIVETLALIELTIDFSQEDVDFPEPEETIEKINDINQSLQKVLGTYDKGMILRQGASVVICGRPNVGKSSLMNALLKHDRVIVTPVAGTTRDVIEESIDLSGVKVRLSDTAGIIETRDRVEVEGIKRSKEKLEAADIVIFMLDYSRVFSEKDAAIFNTIKDKKVVVVVNKTDLSGKLRIKEVKEMLGVKNTVELSVLKNKGIEELEDAIAEKLFEGKSGIPEGPIVTNMRHKTLLEKAVRSMDRCIKEAIDKEFKSELVASDLNDVVYHLGLIIGESVSDDVLDKIFSQFCVGK